MTNEDETRDRLQMYWDAIREHVCRTCLDQRDDGECGLARRSCALQAHLPRLAEVLSRVQSPRMDEYEAAVRAEILVFATWCSYGSRTRKFPASVRRKSPFSASTAVETETASCNAP